MKKEKKQQDEIEEVVLGEKIRDVKTNEKQHFLLFVSMLILFNVLLIISVWFVLLHLKNWYNWVFCFALLGVGFALSFKTYRDIKNFHKCELYDNAIVINSIWFNLKVALKDIYEMNVKVSKLDKIFNLNTKSLEIKILGHKRKKFTIHFIEENAVKLKQEITMLIDRNQEENLVAESELNKKTDV